MKRFFYTDSLAAAWMAKHFGMRFDSCANSFCFTPYGAPISFHPERFYIHPDSLHLLEPQDYDLADWNGKIIQIYGNGRRKTYAEIGDERTEHLPKNAECKIFQRNGMAFHWPEVEE